MTLPDQFLTYPQRHRGYDHDRYDALPQRRTQPIVLPGGALLGVWIVVLLEYFPLDPSGTPFKAAGAMQTPYPDLRHYSARDYGNRIGVYRILDVLAQAGVHASFAVQGAVAERYPGLVADVVAGGHEICAHGWDSDHLHHSGLSTTAEADLIAHSLAAVGTASGTPPAGWISPARAESFRTPDLLAAAGLRWFADWAHDDVPTAFRTTHGPLAALPLSNEIDDWQIMVDYKRPESEWVSQLADAATLLRAEADRFGPRILSLTVRPYVSGLPYRIGAFRDGLHQALSQDLARPVLGADLAACVTP